MLDAGCEKIAKEFKAWGEMPKKIITLLDRPETFKDKRAFLVIILDPFDVHGIAIRKRMTVTTFREVQQPLYDRDASVELKSDEQDESVLLKSTSDREMA